MTTTNLLVEILVIGFCAIPWVGALLQAVTGVKVSWPTGVEPIVPLLVASYVLGILVNLVADRLLDSVDSRVASKQGGKDTLQKARVTLIVRSKEAGDYVQQRRSVVRILRGSVVNLLGTLIVISANLGSVRDRLQLQLIPSIAVCVILIAVVIYGYHKSLGGYYKFIQQALEASNVRK